MRQHTLNKEYLEDVNDGYSYYKKNWRQRTT